MCVCDHILQACGRTRGVLFMVYVCACICLRVIISTPECSVGVMDMYVTELLIINTLVRMYFLSIYMNISICINLIYSFMYVHACSYDVTLFAQRQLDVLNNQLADNKYIAGDFYSIADIAIWPWYGVLVQGTCLFS